MKEVKLHVYDVTNSASEKTNNTIMQINRFFKDGIGIGGIFHSAVQVYGEEEWSFGFCEQGSGVFAYPCGKNPEYTYRECIVLGHTYFSSDKVSQILRELSREWPGCSYDLLSKNCNHFCDELCERLGAPRPPGWVNRFAHAGDTALEVAETTATKLRQAKTEIVSASRVAYRFIASLGSSQNGTGEAPAGEPRGRLQAAWLRNLVAPAARPSTSEGAGGADDGDGLLSAQRSAGSDERNPNC